MYVFIPPKKQPPLVGHRFQINLTVLRNSIFTAFLLFYIEIPDTLALLTGLVENVQDSGVTYNDNILFVCLL